MMTGRMQRWADAIDVVARKMQKARTGQELVAPRPKMTVFNSTVKNAWVSSSAGCLGGPVDISAVSPTPPGANIDPQAAAAAALEQLTVEPAVTRHVPTIDDSY